MSQERVQFLLAQQEAAQGADGFQAPGSQLLSDETRDRAEASEWISDDAISWSSPETQAGVAKRRANLYEAIRNLELAIARPSGLADWRMEIEAALSYLETALKGHVEEIESESGLFVEILDRSPHLASEIEDLKAEHRELMAACHEALSMTADWSSAKLRRKVNILLVQLAVHRQVGAELLYDAYNVDIAAGD